MDNEEPGLYVTEVINDNTYKMEERIAFNEYGEPQYILHNNGVWLTIEEDIDRHFGSGNWYTTFIKKEVE